MILIVFGLIMAGLIIFIVHIRRNEYRPKPLQYVSKAEDYANSQFVCPIHNSYFGHMGVTCPSCDREYHNDINAGVYPPGINKSNKEFYYVEDWIALRKIDLERDRRIKEDKIAPEVAEQEAIEKRDEYIMKTIAHRIAVATGTDLEIQKAKIKANAKRLHYAGAAQYSGITIPK